MRKRRRVFLGRFPFPPSFYRITSPQAGKSEGGRKGRRRQISRRFLKKRKDEGKGKKVLLSHRLLWCITSNLDKVPKKYSFIKIRDILAKECCVKFVFVVRNFKAAKKWSKEPGDEQAHPLENR